MARKKVGKVDRQTVDEQEGDLETIDGDEGGKDKRVTEILRVTCIA